MILSVSAKAIVDRWDYDLSCRYFLGDAFPTVWPEVYRKIRDAGKLIQCWGNLDTLDALAVQLGTAKGIVMMNWTSDLNQALGFLKRYGAAS